MNDESIEEIQERQAKELRKSIESAGEAIAAGLAAVAESNKLIAQAIAVHIGPHYYRKTIESILDQQPSD
jgi:hypothetical protein